MMWENVIKSALILLNCEMLNKLVVETKVFDIMIQCILL
jgi:hypothetical protein